ncbi:MAG: HAMP domain-containing histidine kinase [Clostridiales bacterium]|nr:HAMP domain-containing histidine kinase [Clostridiales bacterium]
MNNKKNKTNKKHLIRTKLGMKLLTAVFCSLCISLLLFWVLYLVSSQAVDKYSSTKYAQRKLIEFEEYVEHKGVVSSDFSTLTSWINRNDLKFMHIYRGDQLIFNSDDPIDDSYSYDERERDYYWDSRVIRFIEHKEQIKISNPTEQEPSDRVDQSSTDTTEPSSESGINSTENTAVTEPSDTTSDGSDNTDASGVPNSVLPTDATENQKEAEETDAYGNSSTPANLKDNTYERIYYEDLNVFIAVGTDVRLLLIFLIVSVILSLIVFSLLVLRFVRNSIMYLSQIAEEVAEIEGGQIEKNVTVKGKDEISYLAQNVDDMRISLIERLQAEKEAYDANQELITAMSHDLRTPLSALIGYLEIVNAGVYSSEEQKEQYIQKSVEKAYQLKNMSDKLFDYFTVFKNDAPETLHMESFDGQALLAQMLAEQIYMLEERGYKVCFETSAIEKRDVGFSLCIDSDALLRVFDNIFSNLLKYADKKEQIQVVIDDDDPFVRIMIKNRINKTAVKVASTKIGLKSCRRLLSRMEGQLRIKTEGIYYTVTVMLKKSNPECEK